MSKKLICFLIALLLLVLGGLFFVFVEIPYNNTDIPDWKTYKNEEYGFEFRYPHNMVADDVSTASNTIKLKTRFHSEKKGGNSIFFDFRMFVYDDPKKENRANNEKREELTIGEGILASKYIHEGSPHDAPFEQVSFTKDKALFNFTFWNINAENFHADQKKILDSFKFTDKGNNDMESLEQKIDTSDWKLYRDEKYKFEMKYPKNWTFRDDVVNAFGGEWVIFSKKDEYIPIQINRRVLSDGNPLKWIKENMINNSIGGGQKLEVEERLSEDPSVYAFYIKLDNSKAYFRHRYLVSNKKTMIYFNFEEINRRINKTTGEIEETSFSKYLPEFEEMIDSIEFID